MQRLKLLGMHIAQVVTFCLWLCSVCALVLYSFALISQLGVQVPFIEIRLTAPLTGAPGIILSASCLLVGELDSLLRWLVRKHNTLKKANQAPTADIAAGLR